MPHHDDSDGVLDHFLERFNIISPKEGIISSTPAGLNVQTAPSASADHISVSICLKFSPVYVLCVCVCMRACLDSSRVTPSGGVGVGRHLPAHL